MKNTLFRTSVGLVVAGVIAYQITADGPSSPQTGGGLMAPPKPMPQAVPSPMPSLTTAQPPMGASSQSTGPSSSSMGSSSPFSSGPSMGSSIPSSSSSPSPMGQSVPFTSSMPSSPMGMPPAAQAPVSTDLDDFSDSIKTLLSRPQSDQEIAKLLETHKNKINATTVQEKIQKIKKDLNGQKASQEDSLSKANDRYKFLTSKDDSHEKAEEMKVHLKTIKAAPTVLEQLTTLLELPKFK